MTFNLKLSDAIGNLAYRLQYGHLMAETDPVTFIEAIVRRLDTQHDLLEQAYYVMLAGIEGSEKCDLMEKIKDALRGPSPESVRGAIRPGGFRRGGSTEMDSDRVKRCFLFDRDVISCLNCDYNYACIPQHRARGYGNYCQAFSKFIKDDDNEWCIDTANACRSWIPRLPIDRATAEPEAKPPDCWYEKDNAA